jgi:anti-sigma regulatory factor (Ser/Thr protein kinase)
VTVAYQIEADKVLFTIRDEGDGFDWEELPDPREVTHMEKGFGRGILIARSSMDELTFNAKGNEVQMVKYFTSAAHKQKTARCAEPGSMISGEKVES